ncbi:MAG TPA: hypothetical protein VKD69_07610 [Vicinamibacterales bacterium]|nr:hypothetical protein [Vicinamibacterales bacterium]
MSEAVRVWRLRKDHTWIEARMDDARDRPGVELQFFYGGSLVFARRCRTRDDAVATADSYLKNLQRAGWNSHW